jgi:hypothetical protein
MPTALGTVASAKINTSAGPIPTTGMTVWWDAADASTFTFSTGTTVSEWRSKVGPYKATQTDATFRPGRSGTLNGLPVVTFNYHSLYTTWPFERPVATLFLVVTPRSAAARGYIVGPYANPGYRSMSVTIETDRTIYQSEIYGGLNAQSAPVTLNQPQVVCTIFDTPTAGVMGPCSIWRNGALEQSKSSDWGGYATQGAGSLGAYAAHDPNWQGAFLGDIAEVIQYDRALTTPERQQVESYLSAKWIAPAAPIPTTGLVGWWDASDAATITASAGKVSQWSNKVGAPHWTQTDAQYYPSTGVNTMNGKNTLTFPGGNNARLDLASNPCTGAAGGTLFWVVKNTRANTAPTGAPVSGLGANGTDEFYTYTDSRPYLRFGSTVRTTMNVTADLRTAHVAALRAAPNSWEWWRDGVSQYSNTSNVVGWATDSSGIHLGYSAGAADYVGDIAEVILYARALSTVERQQVESYLAAKWLPAPPPIPLSIPWHSAFWASDPTWTPPADGGAVSSWRNAGTSAAAAIQATPAQQPVYRAAYANLNGKPVVDYDGTRFLQVAGSIDSQPIHWYFVTYGTGISGGQYSLTDGNPARNLIRTADGGTMLIFGGSAVVSFGTEKFGATHLSVLFNGANSSVRVNGQNFTNLNPGLNGQDSMWVGASLNGSNPYAGGIAFFACITRALTTQELSDLSAWAVAFYGVPPL